MNRGVTKTVAVAIIVAIILVSVLGFYIFIQIQEKPPREERPQSPLPSGGNETRPSPSTEEGKAASLPPKKGEAQITKPHAPSSGENETKMPPSPEKGEAPPQPPKEGEAQTIKPPREERPKSPPSSEKNETKPSPSSEEGKARSPPSKEGEAQVTKPHAPPKLEITVRFVESSYKVCLLYTSPSPRDRG